MTGWSRRQFLSRASGGFGGLALASMLGLSDDVTNGQDRVAKNPLASRRGHYPAKADRVIFIFATGGVSHIDAFDYKPRLVRDHGKSVTAARWLNQSGNFKRYLIKPRWKFRPYGENGTLISDLFPRLGSVIDDVCLTAPPPPPATVLRAPPGTASSAAPPGSATSRSTRRSPA